MERLFSPWRSKYIASFSEKNTEGDCVFCRAEREHKDAKHLVIVRKRHCMVLMNLYPYNSGHLMIVPYTHTSWFGDLSKETYTEVMATASEMMEALSKVMSPHGFNFGANLGRVAGAGIDQHVHFHIVPRWNGDTNFMPVLADVKMVSEDMKQTYRRLRKVAQKK